MPLYQRVYIPHDVLLPHAPSYVEKIYLYGFVKLNKPGELADTFVYCSARPILVHVHPIGWTADFTESATDDQKDDWSNDNIEVDDTSSDYNTKEVLPYLDGEPFEADNDDEAREEAQGNW